jgi:hypothetical protein
MADDNKKEQCERDTRMRMDLDDRTSFGRPRPLVEPRPFSTDEDGRPVAMAADATPSRATPRQPFVLEEPKHQ